MKTRFRRAFTLFQLLIVLALLAILFALFLPAIAKARLSAARAQSASNLRQIGIALFSYQDAIGTLPPGKDDNNFSTFAYLLPYLDQQNVYNQIDFKKSIDDKTNAAARKVVIKTFLNLRDGAQAATTDYGPTNYLVSAGSKPALEDNNGMFYLNSKVKIPGDIPDGCAVTMMAGESLKGNGGVKATTVKRQHVLLKKDDLKGLKDEAGAKNWENNKNIAADRCASWMDGRFLQSTFTATRTLNDEKPDVNCAGFGGLSGLRCEEDVVNILLADGSVLGLTAKIKLATWKDLADKADGNPWPPDF